MSGDPVVHLFEIARQARESSDQLTPLVFWMSHQDRVAMAVAAQTREGGIAGGLADATAMLREAEGFPAMVAIAVDAFGRVAEQDDDGTPISAADLDKRFEAGDGRVVEQIMMFVAHPFGPTKVYRQVYRNTMLDGWEWDPVEEVMDPVLPDDRLLKVVRAAVASPTTIIEG